MCIRDRLNIVHSSGSNTLDMEGKRLLYSIPRQDNQYPKNELSIDFKIADNKIYRTSDVLENPTEFPGGDAEMLKFISKNLHFPPEAAESSIQGTVICGFIVEKDGSIGTVEIIRPLDRYIDAEAMRVIKRMPKWKTGKINGKPVRVYCIVPIKIKLS
jgi:protein TonB